jgi:hypothetical protein
MYTAMHGSNNVNSVINVVYFIFKREKHVPEICLSLSVMGHAAGGEVG